MRARRGDYGRVARQQLRVVPAVAAVALGTAEGLVDEMVVALKVDRHGSAARVGTRERKAAAGRACRRARRPVVHRQLGSLGREPAARVDEIPQTLIKAKT